MQFQPRLKQLTDKQIDVYALKGFYGRSKQLDWLAAIRQGRLTYLDARILKGEFGSEAQQALAERKRKHKRKTTGVKPKSSKKNLPVSAIEKLLADCGLE